MQKKIVQPNGKIKVVTINDEPSKTQQQFRDETNIVNIMKKYHSGQAITHLNQNPGRYVDLTQIKDYAKSLQTVIDANDAFMQLSSGVRKRFSNNPQELLMFLEDPKNRAEAIDLGLIDPPPPSPSPTVPQT